MSSDSKSMGKVVKLHVKTGEEKNDQEHIFESPVGVTLLQAVRDIGKLDIEAACDGTCACSTCHVILSPDSYRTILESNSEACGTFESTLETGVNNEISEEEMDMLDLAPSLCETSRLACQVLLTEKLEGKDIFLRIPVDNG